MTDEEVADAAIEACVAFLAEDRKRILKAFRQHRLGSAGLCISHTERWPCFTFRMAEAASSRLRNPPKPREARECPKQNRRSSTHEIVPTGSR